MTASPATDFPARAMVLAAGRGERLGPLTARQAKPSLPLAGVPLLRRLLDWLAGAGIREAIVNLHYRPETLEPILKVAERRLPGFRVLRSPESELLGTSGGLSRAAARFGLARAGAGPLLVVNGDTLPTADLPGMVRFHGAGGGEATLLGDPDPGPEFVGERRLVTDRDGTLTGLSAPGESGFGFAGVWLLEAAALDYLNGGPGGLSRDLLPGLIAAGSARVFPNRAPWYEIGTPRRYLEASRRALEENAFPPVGDRSPGARSRQWGPGARAAPTELVGAGSVLEEGARVEESVLLEDVRVGAGAVVRGSVVAAAERIPAGARIEDALFAGGVAAPL